MLQGVTNTPVYTKARVSKRADGDSSHKELTLPSFAFPAVEPCTLAVLLDVFLRAFQIDGADAALLWFARNSR